MIANDRKTNLETTLGTLLAVKRYFCRYGFPIPRHRGYRYNLYCGIVCHNGPISPFGFKASVTKSVATKQRQVAIDFIRSHLYWSVY